MIFRFPYPLTFDPAATQSGAPTIANRGRNEIGSRDFFLQTHRDHPSMAHQLSSFGMDAGVPTDDLGRRIRVTSALTIVPTFDFNIFFWAGGVFSTATTLATVNVFVEEFDALGNFLGGIDGGSFELFHSSAFWISGHASGGPGRQGVAIPSDPDHLIIAAPGRSYRIWIDVHGEVRGAGFGTFGGSGATAQVLVRVRQVEFHFVRL